MGLTVLLFRMSPEPIDFIPITPICSRTNSGRSLFPSRNCGSEGRVGLEAFVPYQIENRTFRATSNIWRWMEGSLWPVKP
jgi:hypothetical protein